MATQRTYLELSEEGGGSHKFYEVTIDGSKVTVRYGRIGDAGQSKTTKFKNPAEASAAAGKQLAEKRRKGYAEAVMGQRERRAVSRRPTTSASARRGTTPAPVLWKFTTGDTAFGIFVDDDLCWVGNEKGDVYAITHSGAVDRKIKLPDGVMCLVRDESWLYCGCNNGNVYDLTGKVPFVAYEVSKSNDIFWLDIHAGSLTVSDSDGELTVLDHDCDLLWHKKNGGSGWMVRADKDGVYHGHGGSLSAFAWADGKKLWSQKTGGMILFGWQEPTTLYAGTSSDEVVAYTKKGKLLKKYKCDDSVYSCAAAQDGKYVFAGDSSSSVYCFDEAGNRLWKLDTTCGSALSMQYFKNKLYIVTSSGALGCIDVSEAAISAAKQGELPKAAEIKPARDLKAAAIGDKLESAPASGGVLVECYQEGGRVRVRPLSPGYKARWHVQFPRNIRTPGTTYVVDGLAESSSGGFYRVTGRIRTLAGEGVAKTAAKKVAKAESKTESKAAAKKVSKTASKTAAKATTKKVAKKVAKAATKTVAKKVPAKKAAKKVSKRA
ncbi:MAG: WGR domain-containing protein [Myxococcales bacterium]|nr:WGR domain-containing protein [Myxococcales bacterium]